MTLLDISGVYLIKFTLYDKVLPLHACWDMAHVGTKV